jgi:hypothetical protein
MNDYKPSALSKENRLSFQQSRLGYFSGELVFRYGISTRQTEMQTNRTDSLATIT